MDVTHICEIDVEEVLINLLHICGDLRSLPICAFGLSAFSKTTHINFKVLQTRAAGVSGGGFDVGHRL